MGIRILYVGEIVGKTGVFVLKRLLGELKRSLCVDFTIANADSATGGSGLGRQHAMYLRKLGVDCLTTGDCAYCKRDSVDYMPQATFVLRPANYPEANPGRGALTFRTSRGPVTVISLLGQSGFSRVHLDSPFDAVDRILSAPSLPRGAKIVDFHASPTAEKIVMIRHLDSRVSAVIGSHLKVLTADAQISGRGTASVTDAGRTGSFMSVGGADPEVRVQEYLSGIPAWAGDGRLGLEFQGCLVEIGEDGRALSIETLRIPCKEVLNEGTGNSDSYRGQTDNNLPHDDGGMRVLR